MTQPYSRKTRTGLTASGKAVAALLPEYKKLFLVLKELHDAVLEHPHMPPFEERLVNVIQVARDIVYSDWREIDPEAARKMDAFWKEFFKRNHGPNEHG